MLLTSACLIVLINLAPPVMSAKTEQKKGLSDAELAAVRGEVGIAVADSKGSESFGLNQGKQFPMQSVCKLPISIAILRLADAGKLSIEDKITIDRKDVIPYYSPIKDAIKGKQSDFTIRNLMTRAICESDNTACDVLIARAGGAAAITRALTEAGIKGVRVDRPEGTIQPASKQIAKFLTDPRDTATPSGMVDLLKKLHKGELLSKQSTAVVMEDLFNCKTGSDRLKAGLPKGWKLAHKTGTGADVAGKNAGTNDVGIIVGPKGETFYVAIFTKGSKAPLPKREAFMAKVAARAIAGEL